MDRPIKETLTIEFKSDRKCYAMEKLYEDLVGMANTDGGWLFLGMEDDGTPTGVDNQHKNCQYMESSIQDNTVPSLFVHTHLEEWGRAHGFGYRSAHFSAAYDDLSGKISAPKNQARRNAGNGCIEAL